MSYRIGETKKPQHRRDVSDTASPSTIFVENGSIFNYAIPCWYLVVDPPEHAHCHDKQHHDHVGWPSPNHPDHICQHWDFAHSCCSWEHGKHHCDHCHRFLDNELLHPIHLTKEGYDEIEVAMGEYANGLEVKGDIDEKKDWIIRITVRAACSKALKEKLEVPYTIFAIGNVDGKQRKDVVSKGKIVVLPGPYEGAVS